MGNFFRAFYSHYRENGLKRVEKTNEEIAEDLYIFTVSQEPLSKKKISMF